MITDWRLAELYDSYKERVMKIVMSSGHGSRVEGAVGPSPWGLREHEEAVRVVNRTAEYLRAAGIEVVTFEDTVSTSQDENLKRITDFHNAQGPHDYDVFVHFNCNVSTTKPVGTECWYMTQEDLSEEITSLISRASGLIDRGAKYSDGLYVLRHSVEPAVLPEICFVDSQGDVRIYDEKFEEICAGLAGAFIGGVQPPTPEPPDENVLFTVRGTCSWFGGPNDDGVDEDEGLAFLYDVSDAPHMFLSKQPTGTTGLARRLDPGVMYVACRWDYSVTPKSMLANHLYKALVRAGGKEFLAYPGDWGPHEDTGRVADLSPALMAALGLHTDSTVEVIYPAPEDEDELA